MRTSTSAGHYRSSPPLFIYLRMHTCCPTVRCGYPFALFTIECQLIECPPIQLLSAFFAVPTLVSTAKLVYFQRSNLRHLLQRLPRLCLTEARYLLTGKEPGPTVQDSHLPFNITSHPEEPVLGKPRDQIVMNVRSAHQPPLLPELNYAMRGGRERDIGKILY